MLVAALLLLLMVSALAAGVALVSSSEAAIAANFRYAGQALQAADAAAERAMADLSALGDWNLALAGIARSWFADGMAGGTRPLADGSLLDLAQVVNLANCHKRSTCTAADMDAAAIDRPWRANNPRWQLFLYGRLRDLLPGTTIDSSFYVVVLVGDDPSEGDGDPSRDSLAPNPGAGVVMIRSLAFGPRGARRTIELTVARAGVDRIRVLSWRRS